MQNNRFSPAKRCKNAPQRSTRCKKQIEKAQKIFEHRPKARNFFCKSLQDFHFQKNDPSNLASTPTAGEAAADDTADKKADDKADEEAQAGSGADAGAQGEGAAATAQPASPARKERSA